MPKKGDGFIVKRGCGRKTCMPCKKTRLLRTRVFVAITEQEREILKQAIERGGFRFSGEYEHDPFYKKLNDEREDVIRTLIKRVTDAELRCLVRSGELTLEGKAVPS